MERPIFDRLIHVPGPNPIIRTGSPGEWDDGVIEACNVFKNGQTYYLYYHGIPEDKDRWGPGSYRLGLATAQHPLGPWTKYGDAPVVDVGPEGSWESACVACADVLKEGENTYYMWYWGSSSAEGVRPGIGLATSNSPVGPWTKHESNPIINDVGYLGAVVKVSGEYYMYVEHPIGDSSPDQGPFRLLTADRPEGPWQWHNGEPILPAGDWGAWDDGGYSEAGMIYHEGVFHTFYGGTKRHKLESIGYAYSFDGVNFHKHPQNPVVMLERCPDTSAFAEVHTLYEPPLFYAFNTQRYWSRKGEDLGVQILATSTPFRVVMPVVTLDSLPAGSATELGAHPPIGTENINALSLTVESTYASEATAGVRVHVFPSCDGLNYDTEPVGSLDNHFAAGRTGRKTLPVDSSCQFLGLTVENLDAKCAATGITVRATLGYL